MEFLIKMISLLLEVTGVTLLIAGVLFADNSIVHMVVAILLGTAALYIAWRIEDSYTEF